MLATPALPLNQGQQAAADGFFQFLLSEGKELIISGPGGYGKTFLMGQLIDVVLPRYFEACKLMGIAPKYMDVMMTATTNPAAEVLGQATNRPSQTIHSFLNLKVSDDYTTGRSKLTPNGGWRVHQNMIIFIDECSMVDSQLYSWIQQGTMNCKIIYVGDHCQLAPVTEQLSPVYKQGLPFFQLTEPMRNANQPALMNICNQLRETVETGVFKPIQIVPGVIDYLDDDMMQKAIHAEFLDPDHDTRILAYSNPKVIEYNNYIRAMRQFPEHYTVGETLVNTTAIRVSNSMIRVEEELTIMHQEDSTEMFKVDHQMELEVHRSSVASSFGGIINNVLLPVDRDHYLKLIAYYKRLKMWTPYFRIKNNIPDLRQRDSSTVHKAQGKSYEKIYIDLGNLSTCHQANQTARLLYVGFSRARTQVCLYGELAEKYGGLVY